MNPWHRLCALSALLVLTGCSGAQSALDPAGPQAGRILELFSSYFWICFGVYVLVLIFMLLGASRSGALQKESPRQLSAQDRQSPINRTLAKFVGAFVFITVVILFYLIVADFGTRRAILSLAAAPSTNSPTIQLVGRQWWWEVQYHSGASSNQVTTANEMHLPIGIPVKIEMLSRDVIHSFWAPNLHGKKDLFPDHPTALWIQADRPGTFYAQCAEFCGLQHAKMRMVITAEAPAAFHRWLDAQRQPSKEPETDLQKIGQKIFLSSTCIMCHSIQGTHARATLGPDLTHLASRPMIAAGSRNNVRGHLAGWILDPQHIKPGAHMPQHNFNPEDLRALLAYLESLK